MTYDDSYGEFFQRMAEQRAREEEGEDVDDAGDSEEEEHVPFYDDSYAEFFQRVAQDREDSSDQQHTDE